MLDKRTMARFALALPTRLTQVNEKSQEPLDLCTRNICSGGAFFKTDIPLEIGTEVELELTLSLMGNNAKSNQSHIRVKGAVLRKTGTGMAIGFENNHRTSPFSE